MSTNRRWMTLLEREDHEFASLVRRLQQHIIHGNDKLEERYRHLIMAAVAASLWRFDETQQYIDQAVTEGASVAEVIEALQPSSCCWKVWLR